MQKNKFFLLSNNDGNLKLSVHFKRVEIGAIAVVDLFGQVATNYEILFTDCMGENAYSRITELPITILLGEEFNIDGDIMLDLFSGGKPIIAATIKNGSAHAVNYNNISFTHNEKSEKSFDELKREAEDIINKAKNNFGANKTTSNNNKEDKNEEDFAFALKSDFNYLFKRGESDFRLCYYYQRSEWVKVSFYKETYFLGKIFNENKELTHIALALPSVSKEASFGELGGAAEFIKVNIYDDFGYLVLVQTAKDETKEAV